MGYRVSLMSIPKSVHEEYRGKTEEELGEDFYADDLPNLVHIHEIGKVWHFEDEDVKLRFFDNEMSWECDMDFSIATKELLLRAIDNYRELTANWYKKQSEMPEEELRQEMLTKFRHWNGNELPYDMDLDDKSIVRAWNFEYVVFELVRIYKTFDWENDYLIWSGG